MKYEEFRKKIRATVYDCLTKGFPEEDVEKYLDDNEPDIKWAYDEAVNDKGNEYAFTSREGQMITSLIDCY